MPESDHEAARGVLVTRPEPGAAETAAQLGALGWAAVLAPSLTIAPRPFHPPARTQALLLTSRAAARAMPPLALPVFTVGAATAAEARACGFATVTAAAGDAAALATLVARTLDPATGPLLLAVGEGYGIDLATALRAAGFRVFRRIAYAAAPAHELPLAARDALQAGNIVAALFFSPRSARCAISLIEAAGLTPTTGRVAALAISPRVADALRAGPPRWRRVAVAARPDGNALLALLRTEVMPA